MQGGLHPTGQWSGIDDFRATVREDLDSRLTVLDERQTCDRLSGGLLIAAPR
ncbi:hypothetical protein [Nocardioides immobilis]|uniref:hypothetical protein n=1 Tax=Nocardioides immobilis TaxID=2049295 RepID=UPI0015FB85CF|nr:hypothetical protein [Nocardioides immobilis]